jgi:hypothetical protein
MDVGGLIISMSEEYSRREKVQEVYESLSTYEDMERISLLKLVIWRERCLNGESLNFETMQGIEAFDPAEYKKERRIKSGVAAIIFAVLPFLKEPVDW